MARYANGKTPKEIGLDQDEAEKLDLLASSLGCTRAVAFRKIVEAGFRYWFPDHFGKLQRPDELDERGEDDFYDVFSRGMDRSAFAADQRARLERIGSSLDALERVAAQTFAAFFAERGGTAREDAADGVVLAAEEYARRVRDVVHAGGFAETVSEMAADGWRPDPLAADGPADAAAGDLPLAPDALDDGARALVGATMGEFGFEWDSALRLLVDNGEVDGEGSLTEGGAGDIEMHFG